MEGRERRGSGERKGQCGEWWKMKAVATGSPEFKWTREAEVPDGTVENEDGKKEKRKRRPQW